MDRYEFVIRGQRAVQLRYGTLLLVVYRLVQAGAAQRQRGRSGKHGKRRWRLVLKNILILLRLISFVAEEIYSNLPKRRRFDQHGSLAKTCRRENERPGNDRIGDADWRHQAVREIKNEYHLKPSETIEISCTMGKRARPSSWRKTENLPRQAWRMVQGVAPSCQPRMFCPDDRPRYFDGPPCRTH